MSDRKLLAAAILENPADNTLRCAYADALDEHNGHPLTATHAELIRVQCGFEELPRTDRECPLIREPGSMGPLVVRERWQWGVCTCRGCVVKRQEDNLLIFYAQAWERVRCRECNSTGRIDISESATDTIYDCPVCIRGNLMGCPSCDGGAVHRQPCKACGNSGRRRVRWVRGFPVVECKLGDLFETRRQPCPTCKGASMRRRHLVCLRCNGEEYRPTEVTRWAVGVAAWQRGPVSFHVTDRHPIEVIRTHMTDSNAIVAIPVYEFVCLGAPHLPHDLPAPLHRLVNVGVTRDGAMDTLNAVATELVHRTAGHLPG